MNRGLLNRLTSQDVRDTVGRLLIYMALALGAAIMLAPFFYMLTTSLKKMHEVFQVPIQWLPSVPQWSNYPTVMQEYPLGRWFRNSLFVAVTVTLLNLLTCSLAGYSFAKFDYWGRDVFFAAIIATLMVPLVTFIIPLFLVVKNLGWINSYQGLIIPAGTSAFGIFLMRQHMMAIPDDLLDMARVDGASEFRIFWQIVLPLSRPALATLTIFIFMLDWNRFLWPLLVATDHKYWTLPLGIAGFESSYGTNYPQLMAVAFMAMLPILVVFLLLQRNFIRSLALTGIKG